MSLLPSAIDQSTCFHQEEIWPSQPYVILMPNRSFARRSSQKSVPHIYNEATHSGAGHFSCILKAVWGKRFYFLPTLSDEMQMLLKVSLMGKYFTLKLKMGHLQCWKLELPVACSTALGCRLGPLYLDRFSYD